MKIFVQLPCWFYTTKRIILTKVGSFWRSITTHNFRILH